MLHKHFLARLIVLALLTTLLAGLTVDHVLSGQPERVKVLISYNTQPGPTQEAQVKMVGGHVRYRFHLVNTIAATLPETAISRLQNNPKVLLIEPDLPIHAIDIELENAWGVTRIGAGTVHTENGNQGEDVNIAIIDSGINYTHPDLDDNYKGGEDFVDLDGDPMDVYGHGTHVAGIACAEDNDNGIADGPYGVVGVAPRCNLYALKVLDDNGWGYSSDLIAALQWAVVNEIQVANLSLGWDSDPGVAVEQAFVETEQAGIVIVAAACNNGNRPGKGENVCWPGKYASVIAVAATDSNDKRASFSSTGSEVELAAPGASVFSTWNDTTGYYAPEPVCHMEEVVDAGGVISMVEACYKYGSGTSMASPHVAGTAALIIASGIQDANGDGRINDEVRQRLIDTADDLGTVGWDPWFGFGLVNAAEAVKAVTPPEPVTDIAITAIDGPDQVTIGDIVNISVNVANIGTEVIGADFTVTLNDLTAGIPIGTIAVNGLGVGESEPLTFLWDTAGSTPGQHELSAVHDLVDDNTANNNLNMLVTISDVSPTALSVDAIIPSELVVNSQTQVTIVGTGFAQEATVTFEDGKGAVPLATTLDVNADGTTILINVVTKWSPKATTWTVRVTNPDGSTAVLVDGLKIIQP